MMPRMPTMGGKSFTWLAGFHLGLGIAACLLVTWTAAGKPAPQGGDKKLYYYGVDNCSGCHKDGKAQPENYLCLCKEVPLWRQDKHASAYDALKSKRADGMGKLLGYTASEEPKCLACHSLAVKPTPPTTFKKEEGVSCVVCHGAVVLERDKNGLVMDWTAFHGSDPNLETWRGWDRSDKEKYGMTDLWDLEKRSRLCASCHIGNVKDNKYVTHEMYAAGHPPLPSFEVVTFSSQMPRHWQYLKEKPKEMRQYVRLNDRTAELEETHLLAIGSIVAFQETIGLIEAKIGTRGWPDFAMFDCYACHHELNSKSWRQQRGYAGTPGRPSINEWSTTLVELGLQHAAVDNTEATNVLSEFKGHLAALQTALDAKAFGEPASVKTRAAIMRDWLGKQVQQIQSRMKAGDKKPGYDLKASAKLLDSLKNIQRGSQRAPDFDSARQRAWAYQVLFLETGLQGKSIKREELTKSLHGMPAWKELDKYLRLTLPADRTQMDDASWLTLDHRSKYEPQEFQKRFDAVLNAAPNK